MTVHVRRWITYTCVPHPTTFGPLLSAKWINIDTPPSVQYENFRFDVLKNTRFMCLFDLYFVWELTVTRKSLW
jgi:hypothetical protein